MLREAVRHLQQCRSAGADHDDLATCFQSFAGQIGTAFKGWMADRYICRNGAHLFVGELGSAIAIEPDGWILRGTFGHYPDALVNPSNHLKLIGRRLEVEAPRRQFATETH